MEQEAPVTTDSSLDPLDVSIEAAVELDELSDGAAQGAPALHTLFELLRKPSPAFQGQPGVSMLADIRAYNLFRESLGQAQPKLKIPAHHEMQAVLETFLQDLEAGVAARKPEKIEQAKKFCLAINTNLVARQMNEIYSRRERSDSRYISSHESSP